MKTTLFKSLLIGLMIQSSPVMAVTALQSQVDAFNANLQAESSELNELSDEQFQQLIDIQESGGDVFNQLIPQVSQAQEQTQKSILEVESEEEIGAINNVADLQADAMKRTQGRGKWAFHFIYLGQDGTRTELSGSRIHEQVRPASTLKVISSYMAFVAGTYNLNSMSDMLHRSDNGMADEAFRSVSRAKPTYVLPADHYIQSLIGYKILDNLGRTNRVIDKDIARSCGLASDFYANIEDGSKLHIVNGSGLQNSAVDRGNAVNKVTARMQTSLLEKIARSGRYNEYKKLLAQPGARGTLARRLLQTNQMGKVYAKTGTLGAVKALAGFVDTQKGKLIFSIIGDDLTITPALAATEQDNIVFQHVKYLTSQGL